MQFILIGNENTQNHVIYANWEIKIIFVVKLGTSM